MKSKGEKLFDELAAIADERNWANTGRLLNIIEYAEMDKNLFLRGFTDALMVFNMGVGISNEEYDVITASAICCDSVDLKDAEGLDERVEQIVRLMTLTGNMHDDDKRYYCSLIQQDKLCLILALCDRSNAAETLYNLSASEAMDYVRESRRYYLPMGIYAKEHYPEVGITVNTMMEKLRNLLDITEIISNRYNTREMSYTDEIFALMEENARLKGMIAALIEEQ